MKKCLIYTWICLPSHSFVSLREFFPGFQWLYLRGGLRDEKKERNKSPLVSATQKQHREPSCHLTWIKGPSLVAAELQTWCLPLGQGVGVGGGGRGWSWGCGLNKTWGSVSLLNHGKTTLCFHVNFIHELTAKCLLSPVDSVGAASCAGATKIILR